MVMTMRPPPVCTSLTMPRSVMEMTGISGSGIFFKISQMSAGGMYGAFTIQHQDRCGAVPAFLLVVVPGKQCAARFFQHSRYYCQCPEIKDLLPQKLRLPVPAIVFLFPAGPLLPGIVHRKQEKIFLPGKDEDLLLL